MALRGRKVDNFDEIYFWMHDHEGYSFVFHHPVFKKVVLAGLNSFWQNGYQILVKNWIFDDPFHKKGPLLVILVPGMIQPSGSVNFLMKWGHWGHRGCWGCWGHWGCRGSKAWKISTEDFRVIQVIELSFISMFLGKKIFGGIVKYQVGFKQFFCLRLLRSAYVTFLKTGWWITKIITSWSH